MVEVQEELDSAMQSFEDNNRIDVFLDDNPEPLASYRPPLRFELDTSKLADGAHVLRIEAYDSFGTKGVRPVPFNVRNGPGIAVSGIHDNDVIHGTLPILVNSYGGAVENRWEPSSAETPSPIPTWGWVLVIMFVAYGLYYGIQNWSPPANGYAVGASQVTKSAAPAPNTAPSTAAAEAESSGAAEAVAAVAFDREQGAGVYGSFCSGCHQADGQGMPGVFPAIAGDPVVTAPDPTEQIDIVLHGLQGKEIGGVAYASPMPAFGGQLNDQQIAAVINYQRTSWGNDAPLVSAEEVAALR